MQLDTLRLGLIKIGGRVRELLAKVRLHLDRRHGADVLARSRTHSAFDRIVPFQKPFGTAARSPGTRRGVESGSEISDPKDAA